MERDVCSFGTGMFTVWLGVKLPEKLKEGHYILIYYIVVYESYLER